MFEFLGEFVDIFAIGSSKSNLRTGIILTLLILVSVFLIFQFFLGCSSGGNSASNSAVEAEIKKIDKAIAAFYTEQFSLPENIGQLIEYGYMEKDGVVWDQWDIYFEAEGNSVSMIEAVSTDPDLGGKTIRFSCFDKMFETSE